MILDKREHREVDLPKQIEYAFQILSYNQGLIQFADGKANALLLINSIFIAAIGPFLEVIRKGGSPIGLLLLVVFFGASILSILFALAVISARKIPELEKGQANNLVFYGGIVQCNSPDGYIHEFNAIEAKRFHEGLLNNIFVVSKIASNKFATYNMAQVLTLVSCMFWIGNIIFLMIH